MKLPEPRKRNSESIVTRTGRLKEPYLPAAFCDTSFLLDYWDSSIHDPKFNDFPSNLASEQSYEKKFIEYLKSDNKLLKMWGIREIIENYKNKINLVFSPACRLEMEDVLSNIRFKSIAYELRPSSNLQRKGKKDIGDIIKKLMNDYGKDPKNQDLRLLYYHFFFTTSQIDEGLFGLMEVDIKNFKITRDDFYHLGFLANLQIGFSDVFHLICARNLGCTYFFSNDTDFTRSKDDIEKLFGFEIVTDLARIKEIIK